MAESTTTDNPTNTDAPKVSDAATQIVESAQQTYGPPPSPGEEPSTTEPTAPADVTGQPKGEEPQPDISGTVTRLEQQIKAKNEFLSNLGIDPDSDMVEKLNKGLITKDDLFAKPTATTTPQATVIDKWNKFRQNITEQVNKTGEVSSTDFIKSLDVMNEVIAESRQQNQLVEVEKHFTQCKNAAETVIGSDEKHGSLPEDMQDIEMQFCLGATDYRLASETKGDPRYSTPQHYSWYADKVMGDYGKLRNHWFEAGKKAALESIKPQPPVNPVSPGTGGAPITPTELRIDASNIGEATERYFENQGIV